MRRPAPYTAIDVGTTKVCTLVGQAAATGDVEILGVGISPARGMHKSMVVDLDEATRAILASVQRAERTSGTRITSAFVSIGGGHISSFNQRGTITINRHDGLVSDEDVARVLDAARSTAGIPGNREIIHLLPRSYTLDGQDGVRHPVGLHGFRLDTDAHIVLGAASSIQNLTKCVEGAGVAVQGFVLQPLAAAEAVLTEDERDTGVVLADVGGGTTGVAVFVQGAIWYTAVIPLGGNQFTQDLVIGLRSPFAPAEVAKLNAGTLEPDAVDPGDLIEVAGFGAESRRPVSRKLLSEILRARSEELVELIDSTVRQSGYNRATLPAGVVFTGGSAKLQGLIPLAERTLGMPARAGFPQNMVGLIDSISDPAYAAAVGLLLWAIRQAPVGMASPGGEPPLQDLVQSILRWLRPGK